MIREPAVVWYRSKISFTSLLLATLMIIAIPRSAWAQASAAISGTVEDASGGVVNGVTITVKSLETGAVILHGHHGCGWQFQRS